MHVIAGFLIVVAIISGFMPQEEKPKAEVTVMVSEEYPVKLRERVMPVSEVHGKHVVSQNYDYSCGSAALATLLNYQLGENFTEKQVIHGLLQYGDSERIAKNRAFSLLDMKRFIAELGYRGAGYKAKLSDLEGLGRSCIVPIKLMNYRHFAVFRGIFKGHVFLADPWRGNISFTTEEFRERWYKNIIFVVHPEGAPELGALKLSEEDLRFIDEDGALAILFDKAPGDTFRTDRRAERMGDEGKTYYKKQ